MAAHPATTIPPDVRARLRGLTLRTRLAPAAPGHGLHAGRRRGAGQEFAQYRAYGPGDDPRHVDWKLHARTDRYFVRDALRDAPLAVWLLLDTSASMRQADAARPDWRKFDAARLLAACVADIALRQGDRCGYVGVGGSGLGGEAGRAGVAAEPASFLDAAAGIRHRDRLRLGLDRLGCDAGACTTASLSAWAARLPVQSLVVAFTDGYDDVLVAWLEQLAAVQRQVAMVQLLGADERDFPYAGAHLFRDPETGAERAADADAVRAGFLAQHGAAQAALARRCAAAGIAHAVHALDAPVDAPLRRLFGATAPR